VVLIVTPELYNASLGIDASSKNSRVVAFAPNAVTFNPIYVAYETGVEAGPGVTLVIVSPEESIPDAVISSA
jgi:hypothetical protein